MALPPRKLLVFHHTGENGGSLVSLRELLLRVDRDRFEVVVALLRPGEPARAALEGIGVRTLPWPGVVALEHTTAFWSDLRRPRTWPPIIETAARWRASAARTLQLVEEIRPDVVHLNSVVLAPSADALRRSGTPFVWHVREMPVPGHAGLRRRLQRDALVRWPDELIFLSETARRVWVDDVRGLVIPEPVDPSRFDPALDRGAARRALGLPERAPVVLFLGGMAEIKGILPLLHAIPRIAGALPDAVFVMLGADPRPPTVRYAVARAARALGVRTAEERIDAVFATCGAAPWCRRLPFSSDVPLHLAACDLLVFPAVEDHFARPIVEAAFMERVSVASRLPMATEVLRDGETGVLVPPRDPAALAEAVVSLLRDPERRRAMGRSARIRALEQFDAATNARTTMGVYDALVGAASARSRARVL
jgi:glycosyltransferase involved in cell wall biosynthesis